MTVLKDDGPNKRNTRFTTHGACPSELTASSNVTVSTKNIMYIATKRGVCGGIRDGNATNGTNQYNVVEGDKRSKHWTWK